VRLLLDECVPRGLARALAPHQVEHVTGLGWSGLRNGELLARLADAGFLGLITTDRNLSFQQAVQSMPIFVIVLVARSNRVEELARLAPQALRTIDFAKRGQVYLVGEGS